MLLLVAEGLITMGCAVTLIVNRKELLHRPEGLDDRYVTYPDWILDWSAVTDEDLMYGSRFIEQQIAELSETSDFAILNDVGASLHKTLVCPYAFFATGSDVTWYADRSSTTLFFAESSPQYLASERGEQQQTKFNQFVERQREGIRNACVVFAPPHEVAPDLSKTLNEIGVRSGRRHFIYIADTHRLSPKPVPPDSMLKILCAARVTLEASNSHEVASQDDKGTAILLHGVKEFVDLGYDAELLMPEKGTAVAETKKLIDELGLASTVIWYKETGQAEFYAKLRSAHLVVDSVGGSFPGLSYTAAIASGRCVLANLYPNKLPYDLPGLHATRPEEVVAGLIKVDGDRQYLQEISTASAQFAESELSPEKQAQEVLQVMNQAMERPNPSKAAYEWIRNWRKRLR